MAMFQSAQTFKIFIARKTGTQITVANRCKPSDLANYVKFTYCPQNWLDLNLVESSGVDKVFLMFALSLIPFSDGWAMESLFNTMDPQDTRLAKTQQSFRTQLLLGKLGYSTESSPEQYNFVDSSAEELWDQLNQKYLRDQTLVTFLSNFTSSLVMHSITEPGVNWDAYDIIEPFTFRLGRLCQNVQAQSSPIQYMQKAHDLFIFPFYFNPVDHMIKPKIFLSPYVGIEVGKQAEEIMYTDIFDSNFNHFYVNDQTNQSIGIFVNNYRWKVEIRHRLKHKSGWTDVCQETPSHHRYLAGHFSLNCQHKCFDETLRMISKYKCTLLANHQLNVRPCSFSVFNGIGDVFTKHLEKNTTEDVYFENCVQRNKCRKVRDCEDWLFEMKEYTINRPGQIETMQPDHRGTEHHHANVHLLEIIFKSGLEYRDYLIIPDQRFIGGVGGIFTLFIGASIMSMVQILVYLAKYAIQYWKIAMDAVAKQPIINQCCGKNERKNQYIQPNCANDVTLSGSTTKETILSENITTGPSTMNASGLDPASGQKGDILEDIDMVEEQYQNTLNVELVITSHHQFHFLEQQI